MSGYIDRDLALSMPWANGKYDHKHTDEQFIFGLETYKEWLETLEPADVVEVKHAKWVPVDEQPYFRKHFHSEVCSNCHLKRKYNNEHYCPNCGAKMDGGVC